MSTELRARELAKRDRLQAHWLIKGTLAIVYNIANKNRYAVENFSGEWKCSCPYNLFNDDHNCKHVQRVKDKIASES